MVLIPDTKYVLKLDENIEIRFLNFEFEWGLLSYKQILENIVLEFLEKSKRKIMKILKSKIIDRKFAKLLEDLKKWFDYRLILYVSCLVKMDELRFFIEADEIWFKKYNTSIQPFQVRFHYFSIEFDKKTKTKLMLEIL